MDWLSIVFPFVSISCERIVGACRNNQYGIDDSFEGRSYTNPKHLAKVAHMNNKPDTVLFSSKEARAAWAAMAGLKDENGVPFDQNKWLRDQEALFSFTYSRGDNDFPKPRPKIV